MSYESTVRKLISFNCMVVVHINSIQRYRAFDKSRTDDTSASLSTKLHTNEEVNVDNSNYVFS